MESIQPPKHAIELRCFWTWMGEDGICRTIARPQAEVTLADAKENSAAVNGFFADKKFPLLVDSRMIRSMEREARSFFSTNNRDTKITCIGVIVNSPLSRVIGNFFMGLNKPQVPSRLFESQYEAVEWLKKHM
jgi:hypothetical protein